MQTADPATTTNAHAVVATRSSSRGRKAIDGLFQGTSGGVGVVVLLLLLWIGYKLFAESAMTRGRFGFGFLTGTVWDVPHEMYGALPYIWGTVLSSLVALLIAVPFSIGAAVFLSEIAPKWLSTPLTFFVELLAAIPSIIYGLWGFLVLCPFLQEHVNPWLEQHGAGLPFLRGPSVLTNVLAAGVILAIMIIPFITSVAREVLQRVPEGMRESSLALGATKWETIKQVALPSMRTGLVGGIMLGLGRAIGETMAVVMVIGNTPEISSSVLRPGYSMSALLANQFNEAYDDPLQRSALFEIALLLFAVAVLVNVAARLLILLTTDRATGTVKLSPQRKAFEALSRFAKPAAWIIGGALLAWYIVGDFSARGAGAATGPIEIFTLAGIAIALLPELVRGGRLWAAYRRVQDVVMQSLSALVGVLVCCITAILIGYIVVKGAHGLNLDLFTKLPKPPGVAGGGLKNAILGTVELVAIATVIAVPLGILGGIFISEFNVNRLAGWVRFAADVLIGIPSIVIGLFAYAVLVLPFKHFSAWAGGGALALIMLPIVVRVTDEMLRLVPSSIREAALAMGAGRTQSILTVVVPAAKGGILTGVMLAIGRVAGETAPLLFTAFGTEQLNLNPARPVSSLTMKIYNYAVSPYDDWVSQAWAGALVLLIIIFFVNLASKWATRQRYAR